MGKYASLATRPVEFTGSGKARGVGDATIVRTKNVLQTYDSLVSWTYTVTPAVARSVVYCWEDEFFAVDSLNTTTALYRSTDGINWTAQTIPSTTFNNTGTDAIQKVYIGKSGNNIIIGGPQGYLYSLNNGSTWNTPASYAEGGIVTAKPDLSVIFRGGGGLFTLNNSYISTDYGATWTSYPAFNGGWVIGHKFGFNVIFGNNNFMYSRDGITWVSNTFGPSTIYEMTCINHETNTIVISPYNNSLGIKIDVQSQTVTQLNTGYFGGGSGNTVVNVGDYYIFIMRNYGVDVEIVAGSDVVGGKFYIPRNYTAGAYYHPNKTAYSRKLNRVVSTTSIDGAALYYTTPPTPVYRTVTY